ncbi:MAG: hypothetical protein A3J97_05545 [Spirochaetes bacterium RIFOXYC1_FULL_54_7]|nr:MAG: hypothetical protein A3J97_05545 [Spirochaetes bacterium RIFOXYC1_FULL_54_7]
MASVITGDVGAGQSTSLRAAADSLHPAQYCVIPIIATTGSLMEFLCQIGFVLADPPVSNSIARMMATVRAMLSDVASKKMIPVILIYEAHLFRLDVFSQLYTLAQLDYDSRTLVPLVLSGQSSLIDKLLYYTTKPFASRIVGRSHMEAICHHPGHDLPLLWIFQKWILVTYTGYMISRTQSLPVQGYSSTQCHVQG